MVQRKGIAAAMPLSYVFYFTCLTLPSGHSLHYFYNKYSKGLLLTLKMHAEAYMKVLKKLVKLHKCLFGIAVLCTFLSVILNLCWNKYLAEFLDRFEVLNLFGLGKEKNAHSSFLMLGILIILFYTLSEYISACLASYTCELYAHEMRMGYVRFYLQSDTGMLLKLKVGEEQSAMQNELKDISDYLKENLFSLMKQFGTFVVTAIFLLSQNAKLAVLSILPVLPLILYCACSSRIIKKLTERCQDSRKKINGLADVILELFPIIKIYDAYKLMNKAMDQRLLEWESTNIRKEWTTARLMSLSGVLSFLPVILLLGFGGFMVINGEISVGIFYIFINLSGNVSGFLQNMPGIYANFRQFSASVGRLEGKLVLEIE